MNTDKIEFNDNINKLLEILDSANERDKAIETVIKTTLEFIERIKSNEELSNVR